MLILQKYCLYCCFRLATTHRDTLPHTYRTKLIKELEVLPAGHLLSEETLGLLVMNSSPTLGVEPI